MRAQKRLESELHEADKENLNSAMVNARDIIRQGLDAMSPKQLAVYVYGPKRARPMLEKIHMYVHERLEKEPSDWESYLQIVRKAGWVKVLYEDAYGLKIEMRMLESNQQERSKDALDQLNEQANALQKPIDLS